MKFRGIVILLLLSTLALTGCWGRVELDKRAFILTLACDRLEDGRLEVTVFMPVPENIFAEGEGGEEAEPHLILQGQGQTLLQAMASIQQHMEKRLFLGYLRAIIISDELATEQSLTKLLDSIFREYAINRDTAIVIAHGLAKDIIEITPRSSPNIAQYLNDYLSDFSRNVLRFNVDMGLYLVEQESGGLDTVLAYLVANEKENTLALFGGAIIRDGSMVGTLTHPEARGVAMVKGLLDVTALTLPVGQGFATYQVFIQDNTLQITPLPQGVRVRMALDVQYTVQEYVGPGDITDKIEGQMTEGLIEQITRDIENSIKKAQEVNADIFGIGQKVYYRHNKLWRQLNWDNIFPTISINVAVEVERRKAGIRR